MKLRKIYNIVIDDIIYETSTSYSAIIKAFDAIRKSNPKAWIQTCYA